ncbi:hypothetical protein [Halorubrum sp. DTA46]|uniref:hypothetical protein n=1 Tax=Halorubrum sp. DTA46 TaxID=3402162 RepID=UPI003AAC7D63
MSDVDPVADADAAPDSDADVAPDSDADVAPDSDADVAPDTAEPPESTLTRLRTDTRTHLAAVSVAALAGLLLASFHWIGLIAAGSAIALTAPSLRRGVGYAAGVGVFALAAFALSLGSVAALVPAMRPIVYVALASALGLPLLGSLARGVV